jgi:hypothetical protein
MATYNKFQDFAEQIAKGVHNFSSHTFKVALTNTAPVATQTGLDTVTNHPAPAAANGYSLTTMTIGISESGGTTTVTGNKVTFTATAGGIGPFQYAILYNDTATSPADALVCWWNYGSAITLASGEVFEVKPSNADTGGTLFTLA